MTTREQIIAAANKCFLESNEVTYPQAERFYAIALEHGRSLEREECAKVCDRYKDKSDIQPEDCAFAIRARSTK